MVDFNSTVLIAQILEKLTIDYNNEIKYKQFL